MGTHKSIQKYVHWKIILQTPTDKGGNIFRTTASLVSVSISNTQN